MQKLKNAFHSKPQSTPDTLTSSGSTLGDDSKKKKRFSLFMKPSTSGAKLMTIAGRESISRRSSKSTPTHRPSMSSLKTAAKQEPSSTVSTPSKISIQPPSTANITNTPTTFNSTDYSNLSESVITRQLDHTSESDNHLSTRHSSSNQDEYLHLGMQCHEKGELEQATQYWRLSAESESPLGLLFYGIALRHGWGCKKDPTVAVRYLKRAVEHAKYDLRTGFAQSAMVAKHELVLAIYELGVCFRHGWGVPKDLKMASTYFEIAAGLGDPDAMNDIAFCYCHGHGVKKDMYKAAKYYRMADYQGRGLIGNSWIWKDKYNVVDQPDWDGLK